MTQPTITIECATQLYGKACPVYLVLDGPVAVINGVPVEVSRIAALADVHQAQAINEGIERAAKWVEQRLNDYDGEHGFTDPETGTREYPGRGAGEEYVQELYEIIEGIRALAASSGSSASGDSNDDESNSRRARRLASEGDDDQPRAGRATSAGRAARDDRASENGAGLLRAFAHGDSRQGDAAGVGAALAEDAPASEAEFRRGWNACATKFWPSGKDDWKRAPYQHKDKQP